MAGRLRPGLSAVLRYAADRETITLAEIALLAPWLGQSPRRNATVWAYRGWLEYVRHGVYRITPKAVRRLDDDDRMERLGVRPCQTSLAKVREYLQQHGRIGVEDATRLLGIGRPSVRTLLNRWACAGLLRHTHFGTYRLPAEAAE